jgi:hypothetical protein
MAKSNRRRKQDRAKASTRQAQARRRRARTAEIRAMQLRAHRIHDPGTPAAELAALLAEYYQGTAVAGRLVEVLIEEGSSPQRLADAAQLMLAAGGQDPPSLTAVTFAAAVAGAAGNAAEERRLIDLALAATEIPAPAESADRRADRLKVIGFIAASGHPAEAVELLAPVLRAVPDDDYAAEIYGTAISAAYARATQAEPGDGERDRAAVARFTDRSGLTALRDAVGAFLAGTELGRAVQERVSSELPDADDVDWDPADREAFGKLAEEVAWLIVDPAEDDDLPENDADLLASEEEDASRTPLMAFAADPATPPTLAARAADWYRYIHYGVWRIADPVPDPGLWCTDLASGTERYVEFPPEATVGLARWTVWLGGIVPVDGIWHSTGLGVKLSPTEGDAAADFVDHAAFAIVQTLSGKPEPPPEHLDFRHAEPQGVLVDYQEPGSADVAALTGKVAGAVLTQIAAEVHDRRTTAPALRNTDGDPMCLISATIAVGEGTAARLAARPDFEAASDEPDRITWWGALIPDGQREAMMAEATAQLRAQGHQDVEPPQGPRRWVRGMLQVGDGQITAEVNSRQRLTRLLGILGKVGAEPVVTAEKRIDPALDFAWPAGQRAFQRGVADAADGWEKYWLDEQLPALGGRTPRKAAAGPERPLLEALLRQFEYEADLLAAEGKAGIDTAWLREQLDMPDELAG